MKTAAFPCQPLPELPPAGRIPNRVYTYHRSTTNGSQKNVHTRLRSTSPFLLVKEQQRSEAGRREVRILRSGCFYWSFSSFSLLMADLTVTAEVVLEEETNSVTALAHGKP